MAWSGISADLRRLRTNRKISLSRLALRVGTSAATVSRYENGWNRFEMATLRKLATALGYRIEVRWRPLEMHRAVKSEAELINLIGRLFWDRRLTQGDVRRYPRWIVERTIQYGKTADIRALSTFLGRERFLQIVSGLRLPSSRLQSFWSAMLRLEGVPCTKKRFLLPAGNSWPS